MTFPGNLIKLPFLIYFSYSGFIGDGSRARPLHGRRAPALHARGGGDRLHHEGVHEAGGPDETMR